MPRRRVSGDQLSLLDLPTASTPVEVQAVSLISAPLPPQAPPVVAPSPPAKSTESACELVQVTLKRIPVFAQDGSPVLNGKGCHQHQWGVDEASPRRQLGIVIARQGDLREISFGVPGQTLSVSAEMVRPYMGQVAAYCLRAVEVPGRPFPRYVWRYLGEMAVSVAVATPPQWPSRVYFPAGQAPSLEPGEGLNHG
ncbi:MAG: hypothetical protein O3A14_09785 [Cyanobacteria bacterium]|nr:hypothetical protein [Cyanobacteriota bacterium]